MLVPADGTSLIVTVPGATSVEPEPPSPAAAATVAPPTLRSKRPGSSLGDRRFVSVTCGLRLFVIVQASASPTATVTFRLVPLPLGPGAPFSVHAIDET